jgi:DNA helicase HerA-like ATPase
MTDLGDFEDFEPEDGDDGPTDTDGTAASAATDADTTAASPSADTDESDDTVADDGDGFDRVAIDPDVTDEGIGTLVASEGLIISEDGDETTLRAYVTADNRRTVRIGKYLLVPYPDGERLFCRIAALEYAREFHTDDATEIHARRAMDSGDIDERDYKFIATLDPVAILYRDGDDLQRRMTDRVPKPDTAVRQATDTDEIKTGLKIPGDGVFVGHLAVGGEKVRTAAEPPTIDYRLKDDYEDGDPLVFRHTLVAGGTGSGKTHAAKNVLRQYLAADRTYELDDGRDVRPAIVQFDPQDEYAELHDDNPAVDPEDERDWERQGIAHGGHDDTKAFVPAVGGATYSADHHRAEQVPFTIPFSMVQGRPWLVAGASLNDNQYGALTFLIRRFFDRHGDDGTYREFTSFLDDQALREELDESGRVHEATFDAVRRRVLSVPGQVFDQDAPAITERVHEFVRPGGCSVVPTYHVTDTRATELVVLALSSLLIDEKLSNDPAHERIKQTPLLVGMDEAHNFLADADNVQARKVVSKFTEAAKQGRKERLGLFLITQDPQDVADPVFKQVNTTVVLNLGDDDAISSVNLPAELERKVPYMEQGQMAIYSPDNSEPVEVMGLPKCVTKHGGR